MINQLRDILLRDLGWKIFSLALAVFIWLTVNAVSNEEPITNNPLSGLDTETYTNLPIHVVSGSANVQGFKTAPTSVDVKIRTRPETLADLRPMDIRATVDLTDVELGEEALVPVDIAVPSGVTLVSVVPSEVNVIPPPKRNQKP